MEQKRDNNQSAQPPTYDDAATACLSQAPVPSHTLVPGVLDAQESHTTPYTFILPGSKNHFLFAAIHDSKGQIFTDKTVRFLLVSK